MVKGVKPLGERKINVVLKDVKNYLGTYAVDELKKLKISKYPVFLIINLDKRAGGGTHWISMGIFDNDVYLCDSLGYLIPNRTLPNDIIHFLHITCYARNLHITRQLQHTKSKTCGYYCVLFVYMLSRNSFKHFLQLFSQNYRSNDKTVISQFKLLCKEQCK